MRTLATLLLLCLFLRAECFLTPRSASKDVRVRKSTSLHAVRKTSSNNAQTSRSSGKKSNAKAMSSSSSLGGASKASKAGATMPNLLKQFKEGKITEDVGAGAGRVSVPDSASEVAKAEVLEDVSISSAWVKDIHHKSGAPYWFNPITGESTWFKPKDLVEYEETESQKASVEQEQVTSTAGADKDKDRAVDVDGEDEDDDGESEEYEEVDSIPIEMDAMDAYEDNSSQDEDETDSVSIEDMMEIYKDKDKDSDDAISSLPSPSSSNSNSMGFDSIGYQNSINEIIKRKVSGQDSIVYIHKLLWVGLRVEIVLSVNNIDPLTSINWDTGLEENAEGPRVDVLESVHRQIYEEMELREEELDFVNRFELIIASPGVSDFLRNDRDFLSFKGFMIAVTTTEDFKKKTLFEGSLIERSDEHVVVSLKGRIVKVPRKVIASVRLPKAKYESGDSEMRKLR